MITASRVSGCLLVACALGSMVTGAEAKPVSLNDSRLDRVYAGALQDDITAAILTAVAGLPGGLPQLEADFMPPTLVEVVPELPMDTIGTGEQVAPLPELIAPEQIGTVTMPAALIEQVTAQIPPEIQASIPNLADLPGLIATVINQARRGPVQTVSAVAMGEGSSSQAVTETVVGSVMVTE